MKPKLYVVGDSTLSGFNDVSYYYPRYGYATQLNRYLDIEIVNLALSGRSSKSYLTEENYQVLKKSIKKGDYLLIGFGHNNEKEDDVARFTSANKPIDDESSFMYSLYHYYIKLAKDVGTTPILCTPIVRLSLSKEYDGYAAHITKNGDYRDNILKLGRLVDVFSIDLTTPTKDLFLNCSVDDACLHHAITAGKYVDSKLVPNLKSVDKAHLNIFGASYVAYLVCKALKNSDCSLKEYLKEVYEPNIEEVLVKNEAYKLIEYKAPNFNEYKPQPHFKTLSDEWIGTCFGDLGCNPLIEENGFVARKKDDKYIVGQTGEKLYGKFHASADGFAAVVKKVSSSDNFIIRCKAKVIEQSPSKQTSFGLMLRDDAYLNQTSNRESVMNNYISAGFLTLNVSTNIIHARECTTELKMTGNIIDGFYELNDEAILEINRLGQSITVKVIYKDKEYIQNYMDFDLVSVDKDYMYICLYSTCGTIVEYSDVEFIYMGKALEA